MRRTCLVLAMFLLTLVVAAPAFGQGRDPFEPQPGSNQQDPDPGGSSSGDDPFEPEQGGDSQQPVAQETPDPTDPVVEPTTDPTTPPVPDETDDEVQGTLANTGLDVTTWSAIAYLMVVLGGCAVVAARTFSRPALHRRR